MLGTKNLGRPPILIADSVMEVARGSNPFAAAIMDCNIPIDDLANEILRQSLFGWNGRNPRPALDKNGDFQVTDLDLLSFMLPLSQRGAVIELPFYKSRTARTHRSNERHLGGGSRFGKIKKMISASDASSFSVQIHDQTVAVKDENGNEEVGATRNFMLVDYDGTWHEGWRRIVWSPSAPENAFLTEKGLWTGNTLFFDSYVHPARWQSIFGAPYLLLKMLLIRIKHEAAFYRNEKKRLLAEGVVFPPGAKSEYISPETGKKKSQKIETLEVELDLPNFTGKYEPVPSTQDGLVFADERQRFLTWVLAPQIQFVTRADEVAYYFHGKERIAHWMKGRSWQSGYKVPPSGRTHWERMVLSNDMAIRLRRRWVSKQVAA